MAYEHKEGQGSLFNNDRKEKETQPDLSGKIMVNGKLHWIAGWNKEGAKGSFISLSIGKEVQAKTEINDEVPF